MHTFTSARRRARSTLLGLLVLGGAVTLGTAAQAHDALVSSDPQEGAVLETAPESIVLSFNNPPLEVGSAVTVVDADGATVAEGEGTVSGTDVVLDLGTELPAGELEVQWRVASSDGHPIEGVIPFTVAEPAAPETTEPAETTEPPAATTEPTATDAPTAEAATTDAAAEQSDAGGLPTAAKVAIGVAALGAVGALIVLVARRLRGDGV